MKKIYILLIILLAFSIAFAEDGIVLKATYTGHGNCWLINLSIDKALNEELAIWYPNELGGEQKVRVLYDLPLEPGVYTFYWDGLDDEGNRLQYRINQNVRYRNGKVVMLK
ncbi:MAG: hypothetical protein K9N09_11165 [Candidatus Cloacimonetes bacterium]|nr:hypothetical protein [Candidatus Cloacimonadota bacterium]MCF7815003.1 hypothetical protein [Candidatus Cloacimonadota bacterium]MCF7869246.1 hypothetical protein [Candidatus Cloacimonadota bacterium]MCF7884680.1 hypothetical protein [Candidatus Cloacimonadota bacterium]